MKSSASSRDPLESSSEDANPIRIEKSLQRVLYWPNEGRMKVDRRILVGVQPCELEFRFMSRSTWVEANPG